MYIEILSWIIGTSIALFSIFYSYNQYWSRSTSQKRSPPEAAGARPFTGHLHLLSRDPTDIPSHINLAQVADEYGPIFTIKIGMRRALVVSSWEWAKELFTTFDSAILSRPEIRSSVHMGHNNAMFGFSPHGPYWRGMRKLVSLELLSNRRVELQRNVRESESEQWVNELYKEWESGRASSVDMKKWLGDLSLNVYLMMVAGKRFSGGGEETRRYHEVFRVFFHLMGILVPGDVFPYLAGWLDIGGYVKRMKENAKEMERIVGAWLVEHREKEYSGEDEERDFMDVMLSVLPDGDQLQSEHDADTIIKATCENLIAGGTDTTTVVLVWAVALLLNNRHSLVKAQQELDKHVGKERRVTESDIENLVYLQAITKETLRLYPPAPLGGTREFTEDCDVGGYHVPKGTMLMVNLWKMQRDPRVWGAHALEFRPERFLGAHKDWDVRGRNFELIPFGAGRRICPGMSFGVKMLHLALANLLHAFELSTASGEAVDMSENNGLTNMKVTPLDVLIAPRLSPDFYK